MSHPKPITRTLKAADRASLNRLLTDRTKTIDDGLAWLRRRGYRSSRSAVARYRQRLTAAAWLKLHVGDDRQLRLQLAQLADHLHGSDLVTLATFAAFLLRGRPIDRIAAPRRAASRLRAA